MPEPAKKLDLSGAWETTKDRLHASGTATLPGGYAAQTLRRKVEVPKDFEGLTLVVVIRSERMQANDIELVSWYDKGNLSYLSLHAYDRKTKYPQAPVARAGPDSLEGRIA